MRATRALSAKEVSQLLEWGESQQPVDRVLGLLHLAGCGTLDALANLPLGHRDRLLLALREECFGSTLELRLTCPACDAGMELVLQTAAYQVGPEPGTGPLDGELVHEGWHVWFRLPTSRDLAGVEAGEQARAALITGLVTRTLHQGQPTSPDALPDTVRARIVEALDTLDPAADMCLDVRCIYCGVACEAGFDIASCFYAELTACGRRIQQQVHLLASTYHWSEADILSMSEARRAHYLSLIEGAETVSATPVDLTLRARLRGRAASESRPRLRPLLRRGPALRVDQVLKRPEPAADRTDLDRAVWTASKQIARPSLEYLAARIAPRGDMPELVLPARALERIATIERHVAYRTLVYDDWGLGRIHRGRGTSALFVGPSGTGKTYAAEWLAVRLDLDLYRVDLSAVVSKHVGETEKSLGEIFDAADRGGVALLLDEADALFGERGEVSNAHDRHASVEVSYLLQRIDAFGGLAILTSNLKDSLDQAFLRRLRFVVDFPFPDEAMRQRLWAQALPEQLPRDEIDVALLAGSSGPSLPWRAGHEASRLALQPLDPAVWCRSVLAAFPPPAAPDRPGRCFQSVGGSNNHGVPKRQHSGTPQPHLGPRG